jgi:hypothetical protein
MKRHHAGDFTRQSWEGAMRITLKRDETKAAAGFFKKIPAWEVNCQIEFSDTEKEIIRHYNLGKLQIYERQFGPNIPSSVIDLATVVREGISNRFTDIAEADQFEHQLKNEILPYIKIRIEDAVAVRSSKPETFEL